MKWRKQLKFYVNFYDPKWFSEGRLCGESKLMKAQRYFAVFESEAKDLDKA